MDFKKTVRKEIGKFSKREFRAAHAYALHKHRRNPNIKQDWYLAEVVGEVIRQNRFAQFTKELNLPLKLGGNIYADV